MKIHANAIDLNANTKPKIFRHRQATLAQKSPLHFPLTAGKTPLNFQQMSVH